MQSLLIHETEVTTWEKVDMIKNFKAIAEEKANPELVRSDQRLKRGVLAYLYMKLEEHDQTSMENKDRKFKITATRKRPSKADDYMSKFLVRLNMVKSHTFVLDKGYAFKIQATIVTKAIKLANAIGGKK